ncbi:asparaginase [Streptomyces silvisoli]|uniref:Asparaginase n=1 Tax=Streptomyces silvisoli TaxID=3034235 RepID=A0ABT5ZHD2_9ACTN|nr:asparaginase [Streptomyces silvisoli]MDF3289071.1 asparaginase [Streptomyces silvisoli]
MNATDGNGNEAIDVAAEPADRRDPRVAVLTLGGTIAMTADPSTGAVRPALSARQLLDTVPGLTALGVSLRVRDIRNLPGASLSLADLDGLHTAIEAESADGADGVVVVQGTDTIEETAFYLDLLHRSDIPVVVTGALRNPTQPGPDGPANLYAAVVAASSARLRGAGCVVVLGDEIHAARTVTKAHSTSPAAFTSPGSGPLGLVAEGRVWSHHGLPYRTSARLTGDVVRDGVRVLLHTVTLGDDGLALELLLDGAADRCHGLVVAGFGVGHVPEAAVAPLERLAARIPVVLTSRTGAGPVLAATYGFPGSERDLLSRGLIRGGDLTPYKARLLLHRLLATRCQLPEITAAFEAVGRRG